MLARAVLCCLLLVADMMGTSSTEEMEDTCSTNFWLMEQALLMDAGNRFNLLRTFYPPRQAHPILIEVNFTFHSNNNDSQVWFWSESEFYLIQPLEIFLFSSLLFSNMPYRSSTLHIHLPAECSQATPEHFQLLTTRLKLYSQSSTTSPQAGTGTMTDSYLAVAASLEEVEADTLQTDFVKVWLHVTVCLFPIGSLLLLYLCDPIQLLLGDKTWTKLEDEHSHGTIAALIQISVLFTVFTFVLDLFGVYFTVTSNLISYRSHSAFYLTTVTGLVIDTAAFVWVMFVLVTSCQWDFRSCWRKLKNRECDKSKGSERIKKLVSTVTIAPMLCLANHFHYVLIAFISDPYHAGSIAIMYTLSFFLFFFLFRQFYNRMVLQSNKRPKIVPRLQLCDKCKAKESFWHPPLNKTDSASSTTPLNTTSQEEDDKCNCFIPGPNCHTPFNTQMLILSLFTVGPLVALYESIMIVLFFNLPITKSIDDAPSRIYIIYQGTGLLIVALLTYNILLNPSPFSISKTLERLAKRLHLPENINFWNRLSDEEKCAKVVATLLERHFQASPWQPRDHQEVMAESEEGMEMVVLKNGNDQVDVDREVAVEISTLN